MVLKHSDPQEACTQLIKLANERGGPDNITVILDRFPYRFVQCGKLEHNGKPDCRIQKVDSYTGRYRTMYLCDNEMQFMTAMEDHNYCCWLDPDNVPAYVHSD